MTVLRPADVETEDVDHFRRRARTWIRANLRKVTPAEVAALADLEDDDAVVENRALMAGLFDAGLAGICYPKEYGGQGLTVEHLEAFTEESRGFGLPLMFQRPTMTILAPTLLDFATDEQKRRHIPAILRGEELWVQFLSEPSGGSDLAAVLTRATRDGDVYVLNGSKIWSSSAYRCDYALCVCRTDWDAPKHRGLSVLIVKVRQAGIQVEQIRQVDGTRDFCQEFFDDVAIPVANLIGQENDGWTITTRLLQHEKLSIGGASPYGIVAGTGSPAYDYEPQTMVDLLRAVGREQDPLARQAIGEADALHYTEQALVTRVMRAVETGALPQSATALLKLFAGTAGIQVAELAARIGGSRVAAGAGPAHTAGVQFLARQAYGLGGGSNEMQRNLISERVLGMPREPAADKDVPFKDVPRGRQR
jgi:alkylation response protein AidB-like acyl-CoA dehydrogenase